MSTTHMLVDVWDRITEDLEDNRAVSVLTAIDYSKAFNRLEHLPCLKAMGRMGASTELIRLVAGFLKERKRTVRVGNTCSELLPVNAGAPQGSVLGSLLFNIGTNDLDCGLDESGFSSRTRGQNCPGQRLRHIVTIDKHSPVLA